ncbi:MAG: hypothetical protein J6V80_00435 [Clostridia bacterium]|nr:hypothetical protein [Clostridia bacterium]
MWIQEYKKLFNQVAQYNSGMNVAEDVNASDKVVKVLGRVVDDEKTPAATQVPNKVIKRLGKLVPDENAEGKMQNAESGKTPKTIKKIGKLVENAQKTPLMNMKKENMHVSGERLAFKGYADDGKGIYESNFPKGTPKAAKSERILKYIVDVWSKKPIKLVISNGETSRTISAEFDPTIDTTKNVFTDATKIALGNRHGTSSEQRVTLDLADDYYQIASESTYNYSKEETGKSTETHKDVNMWHYFVNDIYFSEHGESGYTPYTVTINVKEKNDGTYVYSYNAEKTKESSTRRTLHAGVNTRKGANGELFVDSIPQKSQNDKAFDKKSEKDFKQSQFDIIQKTNPMWDEYHTGIRSVEDIRTWDEVLKLDDESEGQFFWGDFSRADAKQALKDGKITVYSSYPIKDGVFVSTSYIQAEEYAGGRGKKVYSKTVPLTDIAWINGDEGQYAAVDTSTKNIDSGGRSALADGNRATTTEVAAVKRNINNIGVDPAGIISIADKYFGRYDGDLTRTGVRYEFLSAAELLFDPSEGAMDRAYARIEALADELTYNEKDSTGVAEELKEIKRHIREITFEVRERDKGEFDSVGGYGEFRKDNFGKLKLAKKQAVLNSLQ